MKKNLVAGLALVFTVYVLIYAQEKITLTVPISQPAVSDFTIDSLTINRTPASFSVVLKPNNTNISNITCTWNQGQGVSCTNGYVNTAAPTGYASVQAFIIAFNKANYTTTSINKTFCLQLIADGIASGTCTGTPQ